MINNLKINERNIVIKYLFKFINSSCNLQQYEKYIENNFIDIFDKNKDGYYLNIANNFYMDENNYKTFSDFLNNNKLDEYIKNNYKKLLLINDDINSMYYFKTTDNSDIEKNNFVINGTLIFTILRVLDFNMDIKKRLLFVRELDKYLKYVEKNISKILDIEVRILYSDLIIPPQK